MQIIDRINEGGPLFMVPILLILLGSAILFILALVGKKELRKMIEIISHISLFGLIWGFLGSTIGLISAFDAIEANGNISQPMFAGGLKVALLCTVFGLMTFCIARVFIIVLVLKSQREQ